MSSGTTAGIVVGCVVVLALIIFFAFCMNKSKSNPDDHQLAKVMTLIQARQSTSGRGSIAFDHNQIYQGTRASSMAHRPSSIAHRPSSMAHAGPYVYPMRGGRDDDTRSSHSSHSANSHHSTHSGGRSSRRPGQGPNFAPPSFGPAAEPRISPDSRARARASYAPQL